MPGFSSLPPSLPPINFYSVSVLCHETSRSWWPRREARHADPQDVGNPCEGGTEGKGKVEFTRESSGSRVGCKENGKLQRQESGSTSHGQMQCVCSVLPRAGPGQPVANQLAGGPSHGAERRFRFAPGQRRELPVQSSACARQPCGMIAEVTPGAQDVPDPKECGGVLLGAGGDLLCPHLSLPRRPPDGAQRSKSSLEGGESVIP